MGEMKTELSSAWNGEDTQSKTEGKQEIFAAIHRLSVGFFPFPLQREV